MTVNPRLKPATTDATPGDSVDGHDGGPSTRTLRILFCTLDYFPTAEAGGAERQARTQARELSRRGHYVRVVCGRAQGTRSGAVDSICVDRLWRRRGGRRGEQVLYGLRLIPYLLRHGREFDLAHVHLANFQADVAVAVFSFLGRPTYVKVASGGVGGEVAKTRKRAKLTRWYGLRHASCVQALSSEIRDELMDVGVDERRIVRLPNGIDLTTFRPGHLEERSAARRALSLPVEGILVLYAGRFSNEKGTRDLLEAWQSIEPRKATLVMVGNPAHGWTAVLPADDPSLLVRSWTSDVLDYYLAADIVVHPALSDGMSNSLLEAMAAGLAPVVTALPSVDGLVEDGQSGLLFPPASSGALAKALSRVISETELRRRLAQGAITSARRFDIVKVVDQLENAYFGISGIPRAGTACQW
jgi:glycosyltransferase involved in cell wall biosynthesis